MSDGLCPIDEYDSEVEMILPLIGKSDNYIALAQGIATVFNDMFNCKFNAKRFYDCAKKIAKRIADS